MRPLSDEAWARKFLAEIFTALTEPNNVDLSALAQDARRFLYLAEGADEPVFVAEDEPFIDAMRSVARAAFEYAMIPCAESHQSLEVACRGASMVSAILRADQQRPSAPGPTP